MLVFKTRRGVFVQRSWIKKPSSNPKPNQKKKKKEDGISTWVEGITGHGVRKGTRSDIGYPNDFDGVYHGGRIESEKLAAV